MTDVFKGMGDEISDLVDKSDALIDSTARNRREIIRQKKAIAELIPIQRELEAVAGDQTTPTALTGDVRGTYDPNSAANGTLSFALRVEVSDIKIGIDQFAG